MHDMLQPYWSVPSLPPHWRAPSPPLADIVVNAMHWHRKHATPLAHVVSAGRQTLAASHATFWALLAMPACCLMLQRVPLQVTRVPVWLLKSTRNILSAFQWARDAADRLVR